MQWHDCPAAGDVTLQGINSYWKKIHWKWQPFYSGHHILTHWGRDKMADIFQTTFSNAFSSRNMYEFWLRFHLSLFWGVQFTISQHWFCRLVGAKPLSEPMMVLSTEACMRHSASMSYGKQAQNWVKSSRSHFSARPKIWCRHLFRAWCSWSTPMPIKNTSSCALQFTYNNATGQQQKRP